ncbi:hypothetical protein ACWIUH_06700 [Ursidibacter arcticus]
MNTKILYTQSGEQFQIEKNVYGYRILQVITEQEARAVSGYYANAGELVDGLVELAIFSGDDAVALADIGNSLKGIRTSLGEYLGCYAEM